MLYAAIHSEGMMTTAELRSECPKKNWLPILVTRPKGEKHAEPTVIVFTSEEICLRFYKRHFPKWTGGWVALDEQLLHNLGEQRWEIQILNYPHKMQTSEVDLTLEIVHFPGHQDYEAYLPG